MADLIERDLTIYELEAFKESCIANLMRMSFDDITDVVKGIPAVNRWIPCSERLPEPLQNVIICTDIKTVTVAWINGNEWYFADTGNGHIEQWGLDDVTHWMPLPEPPEKECDDDVEEEAKP